MRNQITVRSAWEDFMSNNGIDLPVRPVVLESWKRSRRHRAPVSAPVPFVPDAQSLCQNGNPHAELQEIAGPVLDHAQRWLSDTHSMLMLTDARGLVLRVSGDSRTIAMGREIGLQQGSFWRESDIGTNAIGTALAMNAPVRIHAFEHFCQQVQRWSCAAAPVRDPRNGRLLGVVDISSPASFASEQNLAHATILAQHIHALLAQQRQQQHQRILQHLLERLPHWQGRPLLALDRHGKILHASMPDALRGTPLQDGTNTPGDLGQLLSHLPLDAWPQTLDALLPGIELDIVPSTGQSAIGALLALPGQPRKRQAPALPQPVQAAAPVSQPRTVTGSLPPDMEDAFRLIIGNSAALRATLEHAARIARAGLPVLLEGETGTGKELFARAIHACGRAAKPFVPVNCGGLPNELIGSEIFGYERGAFTGALQTGRAGKLEAADGGTFCLDEIGEMPLNLQPYLLRVLEDRQVFRIGSHTARPVDVRIIAMTNRDMAQEISAGRFRQDLFYRIAVTHLHIPPLRQRADDIAPLAQHFAAQAAHRIGREPPVFSAAAMDRLLAYSWPGNIRQLRNCIETLTLLDGHGWIDPEHLPADILAPPQDSPASGQAALPPPATGTRNLHQLETDTMLRVIQECRGNLSAAAKCLGIARSTLYSRLGRLH